MRHQFFVIFFTLFISFNASANNYVVKQRSRQSYSVQDTTLAYLLSIDFNRYIGKPVDSILAVLPANFTSRTILGLGNFRYARMLAIEYPDSSMMIIVVKNFVYMNQYSSTMTWDLNLFKKETTFCIAVYGKDGLKRPDEECDPYDCLKIGVDKRSSLYEVNYCCATIKNPATK